MRLGTRLVIEHLRELAAQGLTMLEASARTGLVYTTVAAHARTNGIQFRRAYTIQPEARQKRDERAAIMVVLYKDGYTLEQIGAQYKITRERVRQILLKLGIKAEQGGASVRAAKNREKSIAADNARCFKKWGCTRDQWRAIGIKARTAYIMQRSNANRRGIEWRINLLEWWSIWQASGHWSERGRGQGYCMCRRGDVGPYSADNVFIDLLRNNSSEQKRKKSGLPIGVVKFRKCRGFTAFRCIDGKKMRLGTFDTPELAHAAYLMSFEQARAA